MREIDDEKAVFTPVQRLQLLDGGSATELPDICFNLNAMTRVEFGGRKDGELKEFTLTVNVITG